MRDEKRHEEEKRDAVVSAGVTQYLHQQGIPQIEIRKAPAYLEKIILLSW